MGIKGLIGVDYTDLHYPFKDFRSQPGEPVARLKVWPCTGTVSGLQGGDSQSNLAHAYFVREQSDTGQINTSLPLQFWEIENRSTSESWWTSTCMEEIKWHFHGRRTFLTHRTIMACCYTNFATRRIVYWIVQRPQHPTQKTSLNIWRRVTFVRSTQPKKRRQEVIPATLSRCKIGHSHNEDSHPLRSLEETPSMTSFIKNQYWREIYFLELKLQLRTDHANGSCGDLWIRRENQGRVVRKPVNVNPGLKVNCSIVSSSLKMSFHV